MLFANFSLLSNYSLICKLFCLCLSYNFFYGDLCFLSPSLLFHMSSRGPIGCKGCGFYLSCSCSCLITYSRSSSPIMGSIVLGTTQNAYLELSNAISNIFYYSQCYSHKAMTLGSVKIAIDGLSDPIVNFFFSLCYFFFFCAYSSRNSI